MLAVFSYGQKPFLDSIQKHISASQGDKAVQVLDAGIDTLNFLPGDMGRYYTLKAKAYALVNQDQVAFASYQKAKSIYKAIGNTSSLADTNLSIVNLLCALGRNDVDYRQYLREYMEFARTKQDTLLLARGHMQAGSCLIDSLPEETMQHFKKALTYTETGTDSLFRAKIHHNIGVLYAEMIKKYDSALYHYDKAFTTYQQRGLTDYIGYIFSNKATVYKYKQDYEKALIYYKKLDSFQIKEYPTKNRETLYANLADLYDKMGNYVKAYEYLQKKEVYSQKLNEAAQNKAIAEIDRKYRVVEKEAENASLRGNLQIVLILLVFVVLLAGIAVFAMLYYRKKKRLAIKEKELQQEKVASLLQEQELNGIDAMIAGQEKERQRIANDLHDNLGSLLATLKLHFQNLKTKKEKLQAEEESLLVKTDALIDEAYQKVRGIAHARNAGVMTSEGLLPAVKNFAAKVSATNQLLIEVADSGLDQRLENTLEITIFRIIQELITNVIKHADASEATIHLNLHENHINIMVEDNGKGFDPDRTFQNKGMGLPAIEKRISHLKGTLNVDAAQGRGTSVIIDIPV